MIPGKINFIFFFFVLSFFTTSFSEDKISTVPLINLENLKPSFEKEDAESKKIFNEENVNLKKKKLYKLKLKK